jgi:hypothetical protein
VGPCKYFSYESRSNIKICVRLVSSDFAIGNLSASNRIQLFSINRLLPTYCKLKAFSGEVFCLRSGFYRLTDSRDQPVTSDPQFTIGTHKVIDRKGAIQATRVGHNPHFGAADSHVLATPSYCPLMEDGGER